MPPRKQEAADNVEHMVENTGKDHEVENRRIFAPLLADSCSELGERRSVDRVEGNAQLLFNEGEPVVESETVVGINFARTAAAKQDWN